jgi:hypothetical protein
MTTLEQIKKALIPNVPESTWKVLNHVVAIEVLPVALEDAINSLEDAGFGVIQLSESNSTTLVISGEESVEHSLEAQKAITDYWRTRSILQDARDCFRHTRLHGSYEECSEQSMLVVKARKDHEKAEKELGRLGVSSGYLRGGRSRSYRF